MTKKMVRLTIEVPKGVVDFLQDLSKMGGLVGTAKEYIEEEVASIPETVFGSLSNVYFDIDRMRKKYGLEKEDKEDP